MIGGSYRNWKKRYFTLKGNSLHYYKNKECTEEKGVIDLTTGLGVRKQSQCGELQWPKEAKSGVSFAIATKSRTFYLYGSDKAVVRYFHLHGSYNMLL